MTADVLVAVPAHNEADSIAACLQSVAGSLRSAAEAGIIRRSRVAVAAHRCTDSTAAIARAVLADSGLEQVVRATDRHSSVGGLRTWLVSEGLSARPRMHPASTWVFSTDADSVVPTDWVAGILASAEASGADLVAGMALVTDWVASAAARSRYAELIEAGTGPDGGHTHVYAANLAVRAGPFLEAGGFPQVAHGEERALLEEMRRRGWSVLHTSAQVRTSGRMPGRAKDGLGALLERLASGHRDERPTWSA